MHLGTLIHDDILDEAQTRRGRKAVHVAHGTKVAVLAGDYLLSEASRLIASLDQPALSRQFSEVLADLCEGELLQDQQRWDTAVTLDDYFARIAKKTSGPFELACEGAALLAGAQPPIREAMRRLGFRVGRLFQMVDDLLDVAGQTGKLGKPTGQDLAAGSLTLPTLVALADPEFGPGLRSRITSRQPDQPGPDIPASAATHPRIRSRCSDLLQAEAIQALEAIGHLPPGPERRNLEELCHWLRSAPGTGLSLVGRS